MAVRIRAYFRQESIFGDEEKSPTDESTAALLGARASARSGQLGPLSPLALRAAGERARHHSNGGPPATDRARPNPALAPDRPLRPQGPVRPAGHPARGQLYPQPEASRGARAPG